MIDGAFNLAPSAELRNRLRELYGGQLVEEFVPVGVVEGPALSGPTTERSRRIATLQADIRVSGFIGKPGVSRADRRQQHLFVNGRPVESKGINFALLEGYHTALMKGQFPVTFLFIDIDPNFVDVNIHPAKREVRFRDEFAVRQCVIDAVRQAIESRHGGEATRICRPVGQIVWLAASGAVGSGVPAATGPIPGSAGPGRGGRRPHRTNSTATGARFTPKKARGGYSA